MRFWPERTKTHPLLTRKQPDSSAHRTPPRHFWTAGPASASPVIGVVIMVITFVVINIYTDNELGKAMNDLWHHFTNTGDSIQNNQIQQPNNLNINAANNAVNPVNPTLQTDIRRFDGIYAGSGSYTISGNGIGTNPVNGKFTVSSGRVSDPDGYFVGNIDGGGYFTGDWKYSPNSLPIPMAGYFTPGGATLSGRIGNTVSGTMTLQKLN